MISLADAQCCCRGPFGTLTPIGRSFRADHRHQHFTVAAGSCFTARYDTEFRDTGWAGRTGWSCRSYVSLWSLRSGGGPWRSLKSRRPLRPLRSLKSRRPLWPWRTLRSGVPFLAGRSRLTLRPLRTRTGRKYHAQQRSSQNLGLHCSPTIACLQNSNATLHFCHSRHDRLGAQNSCTTRITFMQFNYISFNPFRLACPSLPTMM